MIDFLQKFMQEHKTFATLAGVVLILFAVYPGHFILVRISRKVLKTTEYWDGKVDVLQVTDATEKTMELRALMSATDSPTAWNLRVYIREKLIAFLQENYPECLPKTRVDIPEGHPGNE